MQTLCREFIGEIATRPQEGAISYSWSHNHCPCLLNEISANSCLTSLCPTHSLNWDFSPACLDSCQEALRRNRVAIIVNKRVQNTVLGCNLKNNRMISVRFQGKPFNITVIKVYVYGVAQSQTWLKWISSSSMTQPLMPKKLKLNGSMKTYKTF